MEKGNKANSKVDVVVMVEVGVGASVSPGTVGAAVGVGGGEDVTGVTEVGKFVVGGTDSTGAFVGSGLGLVVGTKVMRFSMSCRER